MRHERTEKLESHVRDTLLRYVGVLLGKNEVASNKEVIDLIKRVKEFFLEIKNNKSNLKLNSNLIEKMSEYKSLSETTIKILNDLNKKLEVNLKSKANSEKSQQANVTVDVIQTFFMVTTFEFFKMFDSFKTSKRVICDIQICIEDYAATLKGDVVRKDESKPDWIDMLVEMLLNLLTINKAWIRASVKTQFKKLIPKLTYNSVKLIVDLLEIEAENDLLMEDEEDSDFDEDDSDNDLDENGLYLFSKNVLVIKLFNCFKLISENKKEQTTENHVNGKANGVKPVKDSDEDSDDSDDSEENMNDIRLNESLNKVFEGQLDDDNGNNSDLNDDAMMEMDKHLAITFKLRRDERKTDNSKIEYKLKALDLIQELFKTSYRLDLLNVSFLFKQLLIQYLNFKLVYF